MSDATSSAERIQKDPNAASAAVNPELADSASSIPRGETTPDEETAPDEQVSVALNSRAAVLSVAAPTPAWPPVPLPSSGTVGRGPGSPASPQPMSNGSHGLVSKPSVPPEGALTADQPLPRRVPEPLSVPTGPGSHSALHASATSEKFQFSEAVNKAREAVASAAGRGPRRARLQLKKVDPWSMMRLSFAVAFVLFVMGIVASVILYTVLDAMGVFDSLNETITSLTSSGEQNAGSSTFAIDAKLVIGGSALLGAVNMVLFTAMSTLGAFIYNVCADLAGGIELTLAERE
ncbi:MAG: hypothetical protein DLM55_10380 [Acidimicrobiales bacterium]|nr:MAG: hypothetical protein DLM55_10380 [Acidimicrobiales bacterium]